MNQRNHSLPEQKNKFEDKNQNFWALASIQSAAFGFPILNLGKSLTQTYGAGTALISIWIGNIILWIIGLATIAMAYSERKNSIENFKEYVGKIGSIFASLILIVAFFFWFTIQIRSSVYEIRSTLFSSITLSDEFDIRMGAGLGLIIALLSIAGIRFIKWLAVISFPGLMIYLIYAIIKNPETQNFTGTWSISLAAIGIAVASTLAGIINLPTFFRHSRSRPDAFFALTILTIFTALIESASIWLMNRNTSGTFSFLNTSLLELIFILLFIVISLAVINLVNIYFATAAWEAILPNIGGAKENAIVGMAGTLAFTFIQLQDPMVFIENIADSFIASLGIILLIAYLVRKIVNHRPRKFELGINFFCWIIGCITAIYVQKNSSLQSSNSLYAALGASSLAFLIFLFIEETIWSAKNSIEYYKNK